MSYILGDSEIAHRRLRLLGEVYAPSTEAFLREEVITGSQSPDLVLDLGCGPGHTTRLLARVLGASSTVGLDGSARFLAAALKSAPPGVSFLQHDVTLVPFPAGPADVIYCRFLLTHLGEPSAQAERWTGELKPGGVLLLDELEGISTENKAFLAYLRLLVRTLQSQGRSLFVGPAIDRLRQDSRVNVTSSRVRPVEVRTSTAARLFYLNMAALKRRTFVRENYEPEEITGLEAKLKALSEETQNRENVKWSLRQMVIKRRAAAASAGK